MRLLDLFCGAGGAAMGYHQAGFTEVVGVDIAPQPNYPFEFVQADVMDWKWIKGFDLIHASPPCQHFTRYRNAVKDITERYEDLIEPTREILTTSGLPFVIENVPGAPVRTDLELCGSMFALDVRRHRLFEFGNWPFPMPRQPACNHMLSARRQFKSSTGRRNLRFTIEVGSWDEPLELQKNAMGVDWDLTVRELSESIPPAYTRYIGEVFLQGQEDALAA